MLLGELGRRITTMALALVVIMGIAPTHRAHAEASRPSDEQVIQTLKEAYQYGFPLLAMEMTRVNYASRMNSVDLMKGLATDKQRDMTGRNNDTLYMHDWLDLKAEPLVLTFPAMGKHYHVVPVTDAWTNVIGVIGTRATGESGGLYLLTGPGWHGKIPKGMTEIRSTTNMALIDGRFLIDNYEDGRKNVWPLMDKMSLTPLSRWGKGPANRTYDSLKDAMVTGEAYQTRISRMSVVEYFNTLNALMVDNPGYWYDKPVLAKFARYGIGPGLKFDESQFSPRVRAAMAAYALSNVYETWERVKTVGVEPERRTQMSRFGTDYAARYYVAVMGLGGQLAEDAIYITLAYDETGAKLDGNRSYVVHLDKEQLPKVKAFWSFTVYDKEFQLAKNMPMDRHTLGDHSGLTVNPDGSIDLYVGPESPGADKVANWLPTPRDNFFMIIRMYWPEPSMINGEWPMPPAKRLPTAIVAGP